MTEAVGTGLSLTWRRLEAPGPGAPCDVVTPTLLGVPFAFESHALPVLQDMAQDPLATDYPIKRRMLDLGVVADDGQADRLLELLSGDGYVSFRGQQNGAGEWMVVFDVRLTAKALKQLDVWPDDNERGLYLLRRVADAFDEVAADLEKSPGAEPERVGRIRSTAKAVRAVVQEVGTEVAAKVISNTVTGG